MKLVISQTRELQVADARFTLPAVIVLFFFFNDRPTTEIYPFPLHAALPISVMDCLWNGLPVVAKAGAETFAPRLGCSVLAAIGLSEWIAAGEDEYIRIAAIHSDRPMEIGRANG